MLTSLLNAVSIDLLEQGYEIGLDWLGRFVRAIVESVGIVGLGIICFTLILKAITIPFDVFNRVKMRKQTLMMREMKPELEKLQKQYANDKTTYNQKMLELQKKNGYSVFAVCLPVIISLVIIVVAFQAFRAYSSYANLNFFVRMSESYNAAILQNGADGADYTLERDEGGNILGSDGSYTLVYTGQDGEEKRHENLSVGSSFTEGDCEYTLISIGRNNGDGTTTESRYLQVIPTDEGKYLFYQYNLEVDEISREYQIDEEKFFASPSVDEATKNAVNSAEEGAKGAAIGAYVKNLGAQAAKTWYDGNDARFLWVKNVWYPDVSYNHPVPSYADFTKSFGNTKVTLENGEKAPVSNILNEAQYNDLTAALGAEKEAPNGYFILIFLSIAIMFVSQFVTMRSQKESSKYQTADGMGAKTQKIMLVLLPLIYAVFAFMYSAAFSIYMCISSLVSLCVTLLSNLIIGHIFNKKEEAREVEERTIKPAWLLEREKREAEQKKTKKKK